tara:strand:+ start:19460 stop:20194 length:735 start_codon:yes stop_codon:yes gene_type:complete
MSFILVLTIPILFFVIIDNKLMAYLVSIAYFTLLISGTKRYFERGKNHDGSLDERMITGPVVDELKSIDRTKLHRVLAQGEYAFAEDGEWLVNGHVLQCTIFSGWCKELKLGFICHPDIPSSLQGFDKFLSELEAKIKRKQQVLRLTNTPAIFECKLFGGLGLCVFSYMTRNELLSRIARYRGVASLRVSDYPMLLFRKPFTVALNTANGDYKGGYEVASLPYYKRLNLQRSYRCMDFRDEANQ